MIKVHNRKNPYQENFVKGDRVQISTKHLYVDGPRKFKPSFTEPYKILRKVRDQVYELELPPSAKIKPIFHITNLRRFYDRDPKEKGFQTGSASKVKRNPPSESWQYEETEYRVEKIIKHQFDPEGNCYLFLTKWEGYTDPT